VTIDEKIEEFFKWAYSAESIPSSGEETIRFGQDALRIKLLELLEAPVDVVKEEKVEKPQPQPGGKRRNEGMTGVCLALIKVTGAKGIKMPDLARKLRAYGFQFHNSYVWQLIGRLTEPGGKLSTTGRGKNRIFYWGNQMPEAKPGEESPKLSEPEEVKDASEVSDSLSGN